MRGFSPRNLNYMLAFAQTWPEEAILQQVVAKLPWGQNITLLDRVKKADEREWYANKSVKYGWSRSILVHQVESGLYARQGKAVTNFSRTLPPEQSDLAREILKDPYDLEFLGLGGDADERTTERGIVERLQRFLLELGVGFAFVGRQMRLEVGGEDFFMDLLFYHYPPALLRGRGAQGGRVQARVRGQDELLPGGRRRQDATHGGPAEHRHDPVPVEK